MRRYAVYEVSCPNCDGPCSIDQEYAGEWWLGGYWKCPHCKEVEHRDQWKDLDNREQHAELNGETQGDQT